MPSQPQSNIFTAMLAIAFIALTVAVAVVWWKNVELTGDEQPPGFKNPFYLVDEPRR